MGQAVVNLRRIDYLAGLPIPEAEELAAFWKALILLAGRHPELLPPHLWTAPPAGAQEP